MRLQALARVSKPVFCFLFGRRKPWIGCHTRIVRSFILVSPSSLPNRKQLGETLSEWASTWIRSWVGITSSISHLHAACGEIGGWSLRKLYSRCTTVALMDMPVISIGDINHSENNLACFFATLVRHWGIDSCLKKHTPKGHTHI